MKRGRRNIITVFFLFFSAAVFSQKDEGGLTRILFIFDASNSMNSPWQGSSRIEVARKIMQQSVDSLRNIQNLEIALRIYGHQTPLLPGQQDCNDTKLEVNFGTNNWDQVKSWIKYVVPKGTTPIARSLEKAGGDFPECTNCKNVIVLVTDGIEACDEDPCAIARALKSKGITVKPFVIGVGLNMDYLKALECIGTVFDASNEETFKNALSTVVSQALNNTTAQISLLDQGKKPTETDVSFTLYDQRTGTAKYNFVHTMNKWGNPDTLNLDPLFTYRLVVHTIPSVEKKNIKLVPGKHNVIEVDAPQGYLDMKIAGASKMPPDIKCIVRKQGEMSTLTVQALTESQKYITGKYDLEILSLPRIYMKDIEVKQSYRTRIEIPMPGTLDLNTPMNGVGAIFTTEGSEMKWVCNIRNDVKKQYIYLQPGNYKIVYRNKKADRTVYSFEKSFSITTNKTTVLSF